MPLGGCSGLITCNLLQPHIFNFARDYTWDDSDVILRKIVTPAMLEVYNVVTL